MEVFFSSSCLKNYNIYDVLNFCKRNNIKNIEFSAPHNYLSEKKVINLIKSSKKKKYKFILHNYFPPPKINFVLNLSSGKKNIKKQSLHLMRSALKICNETASNIYGVHPGYLMDAQDNNGKFQFYGKKLSYREAEKNSISIIKKISKESKNINFAVENLFPNKTTNNSLFCNYNQINRFLKKLPSKIKLILDLGHLEISCKFYKLNKDDILRKILKNYSTRIVEFHISGNNCVVDQHKIITKNSWQYKSLKLINYYVENPIICLEARNSKIRDILKCYRMLQSYEK